jgi:hypothetical protein
MLSGRGSGDTLFRLRSHLHSSSSSCPYFTNHYYIYILCCILGGGATRAQAHAPAAACRARERCGFTEFYVYVHVIDEYRIIGRRAMSIMSTKYGCIE